MKFKAIIFDMDGTIVDTTHIWKNATSILWKSKCGEKYADLEAEILEEAHGLVLQKVCQIIKDRTNSQESLESLVTQKMKIVCEQYEKGVKFIPGFENFFEQIIKHNIPTSIATNADKITLEYMKKALNLEKLFGPHIYDISHVDNIGKPDPAVYLFAADKLGIDPSQCIAIEDSAHGIKAAKCAGMYCIGINTANDAQALNQADRIIDCYNELKVEDLIKL